MFDLSSLLPRSLNPSWSTVPLVMLLMLVSTGCTQEGSQTISPRTFQIQQSWQFQPGTQIVGHEVIGGLGDISIALRGSKVYAPFTGQVQPHQADCFIFSSPEVPAYILRLCGLQNPKLGAVQAGEAIASSQLLSFAVLRKQPDGTWALVEPSISLLEQVLKVP